MDKIIDVEFKYQGWSPIRVIATLSSGEVIEIFSYFSDELGFSPDEFIGKTVEEAVNLYHEKDVAYLRS